MPRRVTTLLGWVALALLAMVPPAKAQNSIDQLGLSVVSTGHGKVRLTVSAGPTGAPNGFEVWWMTIDQFTEFGWPARTTAGLGWADYTGTGTLHTWGAPNVNFKLAPNQSLDVEIGDNFDETGIGGTVASELDDATEYVFCAFAYGTMTSNASPLSVTLAGGTSTQGQNCTYTIGFWKGHTLSWPVSSLTLGTVNYNASQLGQILNQSVTGNGLVSLAHQLIAVKLDIANGADPTSINGTIAAADALIGSLVPPPVGAGYLSPSSTSALTQVLSDYNNGLIGPGHCGSTPVRTSTWGQVKALYR